LAYFYVDTEISSLFVMLGSGKQSECTVADMCELYKLVAHLRNGV